MATEPETILYTIGAFSKSLYSIEGVLTLALIVMSLFLRALIGKDATLPIWMNSFLQTPGDIAFAATSFLISILLKHGSNSDSVAIALVIYFVMLLLIYYIQHCAQKNLEVGKYIPMGSQQCVALLLSLLMLTYAISKLASVGPMI
jgi:hypothetical protein